MSRNLALASLLILAACDPDDGPTRVTIVAGSATSLIAVQDEADPEWRVVPTPTTGKVEVDLVGTYAIVGVCEDGPSTEVRAVTGGPGDLDRVDVGCASSVFHDVTVAVTGDTAVTLDVGNGPFTVEPATATTFPAPEGILDLVAIEQTFDLEVEPRFVIERGLVVDRDLSITLELDDDDRLERHEVAVTGAVEASDVDLEGRLITAGGAHAWLPEAWGPGEAREAFVVPSDALVAGDRQAVWASEGYLDETGVSRTAAAPVPGLITIAMAEPLDSIETTWDAGPAATWSPDGAWDRNYVGGSQALDDGTSTLWHLWTWPGSPVGELRFPDVAAIPGWDPSWDIDLSERWRSHVELGHETATTGQMIELTRTIEGR